MIFALVTLRDGRLIRADSFTFESYIEPENGVIRHTCPLSLRPHKEALLCQIFTPDTTLLLKGNVLVIVLSLVKGND